MHHRDRKLAIKPQFDDCFAKCPKNEAKKQRVWNENRRNFCDDCDHKKEQDYFKEQVAEEFDIRFGETDFDFQQLYNLVIEIAGFEKHKRLTVYAQSLLNTYLNERWKYDRFKDAQKPNG